MDIENVDVKNWKSLIKPTKLDVKISDDLTQSPFNQSTRAPEDEAKVVRQAVPIEASNAYCVAV